MENTIDTNLPLIDLHRHLDGNIRLQTILELGLKHNLPLPAHDLEGLRPHVQMNEAVPGVMAFIEKFKWMVGVLADVEACRQVAYENVEDAFGEGINYIELRFSPLFMAEAHQLDLVEVVEAVADGVNAGQRDFGVRTNLIGILSRTYGLEMALKELDALLLCRDLICGLDLAGDEANFPAELFIPHFHKAHDAGWHFTVHAGESSGPESIWSALKQLGAERIGHGVSAIQDPVLMDYLRDEQIGIESNLTSNVQTRTVPDYASHPLRRFLEHGILATINSDDPGISGINLAYEYTVAAPAAGLSRQQIQQAQRNALEVAFLSDEEKRALVAGIHPEEPLEE